jgi:uroporphyrinogen-III decarboxylase
VQARSGKAVIGGLRNETLQTGDPADVLSEARSASIQTTNRLWMIGPACSISVETPDANVRAARQAVDQLTV